MSTAENTTITLVSPIAIGKKNHDKISLREPKGGDLRGLSLFNVMNGDVDSIATLAPRISDPMITKEHVQAMSAPNVFKLTEGVVGFFVPEDDSPNSPTE